MKTSIIIALLYPLVAFGQRSIQGTLYIFPLDSRAKEYKSTFTDFGSISIFKGKKLIKIIDPYLFYQTPIKLELPNGIYKIKYENLFGQKITKTVKVNISQRIQDSLNLYIDSLIIYQFNTLRMLQNCDSIEIKHSSWGCQATPEERITLYKSNGLFTATVFSRNSTDTVALTMQKINAFIRFENEIRAIEEINSCTMTDGYEITSPIWNLRKEDGSCLWHGYFYLKKELLLK